MNNKEKGCRPGDIDNTFYSTLVPLVDPLSEHGAVEERLGEIIGRLEESEACQTGLKVLRLHWGERLPYRESGRIIGEEEGREPYQNEVMRQVEAGALRVLRYYIRTGKLPPSK